MDKTLPVVITGVSTGIGYGLARTLVNKGYTVFGSVRKTSDVKRLQQELGTRFQPFLMDVTDHETIKQAAREIETATHNQGIGALINNAGIAISGPMQELDIADIRYQFEVNVIGLVKVTQLFLPLLGARENHPVRPGRILNISSVSGQIAAPFLGPYTASKHALEGLSKVWRRELLLFGIDVIVVGPGSVVTPIWDKRPGEDSISHSAYFPALKKFSSYLLKQGRNGLPVHEVANRMVDILEHPKPKARYALVKNRFRDWILPRAIPTRKLDQIIGRKTGLLPSMNRND